MNYIPLRRRRTQEATGHSGQRPGRESSDLMKNM